MGFVGLTLFVLALFYLINVYSRPTGKLSYLKYANISCIKFFITSHGVCLLADKKCFLYTQPDVFCLTRSLLSVNQEVVFCFVF